MSTSIHSPPDMPEPTTVLSDSPPQATETITVTGRRNRAPGFEHRHPILFNRRNDVPIRDGAHWGPACRVMVKLFLTPALILLVAALISIAWFTM